MTDKPHGHHHAAEGAHGGNERIVFRAMLLTGGFMLAEVAGGLLSGSLALLADAAHMLTDSAALGLAWAAFRIARRPADARRSYGYHRFQVLAAFVNGGVMIALAGWIIFEAALRITAPEPVLAWPMLVIAVMGLMVNIAAYVMLHSGDRENLNIRGAALHVIGDLLGSVAAIIAAIVILVTGWMPIDPILSVLVAGLVLRSAWVLVRRSSHILLEGAPENFDIDAVRRELFQTMPDILDIHHIHAWTLGDGKTILTLHATVDEKTGHAQVLGGIKSLLRDHFGISHSTVQIESRSCPDE